MQNLDIHLYIIGKNTSIFESLAKKHNISHTLSHTIQNAVEEIKKSHSHGAVALLSPACASFDQFKGYKQRGEIFKSLVQ
jgi:UDP-N-acetylmuramoylalanine--D-glutamate ligase